MCFSFYNKCLLWKRLVGWTVALWSYCSLHCSMSASPTFVPVLHQAAVAFVFYLNPVFSAVGRLICIHDQIQVVPGCKMSKSCEYAVKRQSPRCDWWKLYTAAFCRALTGTCELAKANCSSDASRAAFGSASSPFSDILTCRRWKRTGASNGNNEGLCSSKPYHWASMHNIWGTGIGAAELNAAIINVVNYTCTSLVVAS